MISKIKRLIPNEWKKKVKSVFKAYKYEKYKKYCLKNGQVEYILFGTPMHGNLGDHAIALAEYQILKDCNIVPFEISTYERELYYKYVLKHISKGAVILITGGGSIGSQWITEETFIRNIISDYKEHKIVIFPQTIFYKNDQNGEKEKRLDKEVYNNAKNLYICIREEISYNLAKKMHEKVNIILIPDIVLYLNYINFKQNRNGILLCIRNDVESNLDNNTKKKIENMCKDYNTNIVFTDTVLNKKIKQQDRKKEVENKLKEFSSCKLVITDRLHGMIFAKITGTPCIAISNYNYKVKGVYEWIKECPYIKFVDTIDEIKENINKMYNMQITEKSNDLKSKFDILKEILKGE